MVHSFGKQIYECTWYSPNSARIHYNTRVYTTETFLLLHIALKNIVFIRSLTTVAVTRGVCLCIFCCTSYLQISSFRLVFWLKTLEVTREALVQILLHIAVAKTWLLSNVCGLEVNCRIIHLRRQYFHYIIRCLKKLGFVQYVTLYVVVL